MARKFVHGFLIFLFFLLPLQAGAGTVLVLGDSLSAAYGIEVEQGWVFLLQQRLKEQQRDHRVVNISIRGETTAGGRARVAQALEQYRPEVLLLALGANDGLRGLSLQQMQANLEATILQAEAKGAKVVLIGMHLPPNYGRRYTERFHAVYKEIAEEYHTPLVPFLLEGVAVNRELMQPDGFHPKARAQQKILETVWPVINTVLR